jgi:hypothetical protein
MALVLAFTFVSSAVAADPTESGYGGQGGALQGELASDPQTPEPDGGLPFTGLDLTLLLGGGLVLLVIGGSMWRLTRAKP